MIDDVISLLEHSEDMETLVSLLLNLGYISSVPADRAAFVNRLIAVYSANNTRQDPSHDLQPLPGRLVSTHGVKYFIHGIAHPAPGNPASEEYKEALRKATTGWVLLCEDGFKDDFFPEAAIFGEAQAFALHKPAAVFRTLPRLLTFSASILYNKLTGKQPLIHLNEIKTIDDLRKTRLHLFKGYLPEPLGMSALLYAYHTSLRARRYVFEAEQAMKWALENKPAELHLIVGCAHELPLEYLLKNPDKITAFKSG